MTITFYLNQDRKRNLYCRVSDGKERAIFSLGYAVEQSSWNERHEFLNENDPYYYTLTRLKEELESMAQDLIFEGKDNIVNLIKEHVMEMTGADGIAGINRALFNNNKNEDVPDFDTFTQAFEKATGNSAKNYLIETEKNKIHFYGNGSEYIVDTIGGVASDIFEILFNECYEGLLVVSNAEIWDQVFTAYKSTSDGPIIPKPQLLPAIYGKWRHYWDCYYDINGGRDETHHSLKELQEESWRHMTVFLHSYDQTISPIIIAEKLGDELCASVILALLDFFDEEECVFDYCKLHFEQKNGNKKKWKKVKIQDNTLYVTKA